MMKFSSFPVGYEFYTNYIKTYFRISPFLGSIANLPGYIQVIASLKILIPNKQPSLLGVSLPISFMFSPSSFHFRVTNLITHNQNKLQQWFIQVRPEKVFTHYCMSYFSPSVNFLSYIHQGILIKTAVLVVIYIL